jgi:hypothetical protein
MITHWLFIANSVHCFLKQKYLYGSSFLILTGTSVMFWRFKNVYTYWFDQTAIYLVVLIGGYNSLKLDWIHFIFAVMSILCVIGIHWAGSVLKSDKYHHLVHVLSSFGHHVILLGI